MVIMKHSFELYSKNYDFETLSFPSRYRPLPFWSNDTNRYLSLPHRSRPYVLDRCHKPFLKCLINIPVLESILIEFYFSRQENVFKI